MIGCVDVGNSRKPKYPGAFYIFNIIYVGIIWNYITVIEVVIMNLVLLRGIRTFGNHNKLIIV